MKIKLKDTVTNELINAQILPAIKNELPSKKEGWNFNWSEVYAQEGKIYKVIIEEKPEEIQGIVKFSIHNNEMLYMENLELAPHNIGSKGRYDYIAGCLIAYCCKLSHSFGKGNYSDIVVFDSKTVLINFYKTKYGATLLFGQRMCIYSEAGQNLISQYLK